MLKKTNKNKRTIRFIVSLIGVLFVFTGCQNPSNKRTSLKTDTPPNIIIILTDDQGYQDLGCYGAKKFATPALDKMASEGVRFTSFYAPQPVCTASRAGLLTGCYPNRIGVNGAFFPGDGQGIHQQETTIAEMLKKIDYKTAIYGKWHLGDGAKSMPNNHGFDDYYGIPYSNDMWPFHPWQGTKFDFPPLPLMKNKKLFDTLTDQSNLTRDITEKSVQFIKKNKNRPFFLYLAHPQPHVPLFVSDVFRGKSKLGLYGDVIMELDWSVGQILKALKENGVDDNTLVIYTSDNGPWLSYGTHAGSAYPLREGKGTSLEGGQREPFIARFPGRIPKNTIIDTPIMGIDILPTIASITGAPLPNLKIDGKDVWPVFTGKTKKGPQEAYYFYHKYNELHGVRYGDWKLYFPHSYRSLNGRKGGTGGIPVPYGEVKFKEIELYNLKDDISETTNVAKDYPKVVAEILKLSDGIRTELGDMLHDKEFGLGSRPLGGVSKKDE